MKNLALLAVLIRFNDSGLLFWATLLCLYVTYAHSVNRECKWNGSLFTSPCRSSAASLTTAVPDVISLCHDIRSLSTSAFHQPTGVATVNSGDVCLERIWPPTKAGTLMLEWLQSIGSSTLLEESCSEVSDIIVHHKSISPYRSLQLHAVYPELISFNWQALQECR